MSKDPAVLFYTADFRQGTTLFSDEETGQYIRLLCDQHQNGHLPTNHMVYVCKSVRSPVFSKFEKDSDGNWFNKRMDLEIEKRTSFVESRRKSALTRWKGSMHTHMHTDMRGDNDNEDGIGIGNKEGMQGGKLNKALPTIEEVKAYCLERGNAVDPEKWFDFYSSKGWMIGKNEMRDWKAAVRTWEKGQQARPSYGRQDITKADIDDAFSLTRRANGIPTI
jgi:uncharacterized protein YdaU (DUF1376 family)